MVLNVAVDFDGVLNTYDGWNGRYDLFEPRRGVSEFLSKLDEKYDVIIFTRRNPSSVWGWLDEHGLSIYVRHVTNHKPKAFVYIDDRGLKFEGDYDSILEQVDSFHTHWEQNLIEYVDSD